MSSSSPSLQWLLLSVVMCFLVAGAGAGAGAGAEENAQGVNSTLCGGSCYTSPPPPPTYIQLASPPPPPPALANCPPVVPCCEPGQYRPPPTPQTDTGLPYRNYTYSAAGRGASAARPLLGGLLVVVVVNLAAGVLVLI